MKNLFLEIQQAWNVPLEVVNDGEVTALAGAMSLEDTAVIGVAMGSSEAGGFVTPEGNITNWLNELAFVPIDGNPAAPADEWSGDIGCGVQYLSQQAVGRLLPAAGITLDEQLGLPERLKAVQQLGRGRRRARDSRSIRPSGAISAMRWRIMPISMIFAMRSSWAASPPAKAASSSCSGRAKC